MRIINYPSEILRTACDNVEKHEIDNVIDISNDMFKLIGNKGLGLSAPQVGINKRFFIINITQDESGMPPNKDGNYKYLFINPKIKEYSSETCVFEEGCLSFDGLYENVIRPKSCVIEAYDKNFEKFELNLGSLASRVFQHEYDHLDGVLFIDYFYDKQKTKNRKFLNRLSKINKTKKKYKKIKRH